jgi:hypothetical protein
MSSPTALAGQKPTTARGANQRSAMIRSSIALGVGEQGAGGLALARSSRILG